MHMHYAILFLIDESVCYPDVAEVRLNAILSYTGDAECNPILLC
jgi:hypothetical protein